MGKIIIFLEGKIDQHFTNLITKNRNDVLVLNGENLEDLLTSPEDKKKIADTSEQQKQIAKEDAIIRTLTRIFGNSHTEKFDLIIVEKETICKDYLDIISTTGRRWEVARETIQVKTENRYNVAQPKKIIALISDQGFETISSLIRRETPNSKVITISKAEIGDQDIAVLIKEKEADYISCIIEALADQNTELIIINTRLIADHTDEIKFVASSKGLIATIGAVFIEKQKENGFLKNWLSGGK